MTPVTITLILSVSGAIADLIRAGPEELSEVNCNGHVEEGQCRDEDQHNGNAESTEQCASPEDQHVESPLHSMYNGVESTAFNEVDTETEGIGTHSCAVTEKFLSAGLEDGELERSILQEDEEDGSNCHYRNEENGQLAQISTFRCLEAVCCS